MIINLILIFTLIFNKPLKGDYHVKSGHVPSYLYKIVEMDNEIFPHNNLTVNISLSKMEGTLLYTIDKNNNQLIITLFEEIVEKIKIEFRKEEHYLSLLELCGCNQCKYRWISLTISINDFINIQCNHLKNFQLKYRKHNSINHAYPIINIRGNNTAAIWMVNTPSHGDYYSNNDQLSGCISEISYNKKHLNMTIFGNGIKTKCPSSCDKKVCNSGNCLETFTIKPLCDCTTSLKNGPYCNSSGYSFDNASLQSTNEIYKFKILKLIWQSESKEIFHLSNEKISIAINCVNNSIIFIYKSIFERLKLIKEISIEMSPIKTIFIIFGNKEVFINGPQNTSESIFVTTDLHNTYFSSMILLNGTGIIDIVYKLHQSDYQWNQINLNKFQKSYINYSQDHNIYKDEENKKNHIWNVYHTTILLISINTIIWFLIGVICCLKYIRNKRQNNSKNRERTNKRERLKPKSYWTPKTENELLSMKGSN